MQSWFLMVYISPKHSAVVADFSGVFARKYPRFSKMDIFPFSKNVQKKKVPLLFFTNFRKRMQSLYIFEIVTIMLTTYFTRFA